MEATFIDFINAYGYFAVCALIVLETVIPPIPCEVILPLAGSLCLATSMQLPGVIATATVGSLIGALAFYGVGRLFSQERLETLFGTRLFRLLGFKVNDVSRAIGWFQRRGQITVLFCRCIPVVRSLISLPAGIARMNLGRFALYTLIGSTVWNTALCTLGFFAGSAWQSVSTSVDDASSIVKMAIIAIAVVICALWFAKRIAPNLKSRRSA